MNLKIIFVFKEIQIIFLKPLFIWVFLFCKKYDFINLFYKNIIGF